MTDHPTETPTDAPPVVPLDLRVEVYDVETYDDERQIRYALSRTDLVFIAVPSPGDNFNPSSLTVEGTGWAFSTTPRVHHVEHYPTLRDGRALGSSIAYGAGATVVVHETVRGTFSADLLQRLQDAGWHVSNLTHGSQG